MLANLKVEQFKLTIDAIQKNMTDEMDQIKKKFKLKTDLSDTLKLEEMLLNMINYTYETVTKKFPSKN